MKHLFIVNPAARQGNRTSFATSLIEQAFARREANYEIYITKAPGDGARKILADAALEDDLRVYACGGDGTINECASVCTGKTNVAMSCFPCGTGNDFVKLFGPEKDKFMSIGALVDGEVTPMDIIRVTTKDRTDYSLNIACVGLDGRIGTSVHDFDKYPIVGKGRAAYVTCALVNCMKQITDEVTIRINNQVITGEINCLAICNGTWYGGSFNPVPTARPDDGILDVLVIHGLPRYKLPLLLTTYAQGRYKEVPQHVTHYRTDKVILEADHELVINLDGEPVYARSAEFQLVPQGLRFLHPKDMAYFKTAQTSNSMA